MDSFNVEQFAMEMNGDHSVIFETVPKNCISNSIVDYDCCSISSKGFLSIVVDIMAIELNLPIPIHFSSQIPKMVSSVGSTVGFTQQK